MANFKRFAAQINTQFDHLQRRGELFIVDAPGDVLYDHYLNAFPAGANPVLRERTEYDCSNCKNFIRNFGGVIAIHKDTLEISTLWQGTFEAPYDTVAAALHAFIAGRGVGGLLRVGQASFSVERNVGTDLQIYDHFHGRADARFVTKDGAEAGEYQTSVAVLREAFERLNPGALQTVLDLIADRQLYRGEEHLGKVRAFADAMKRHFELSPAMRERHLAVLALNPAVARFKNSVIGTLVADLAEGEDLEGAVRSFEAKVAPHNYQRTSQIITQRMVDDALKTIEALGLHVERRMAKLDDVSVNNVLWVDNSVRPLMKGGLAGVLAGAVARAPLAEPKGATRIDIEAFMRDVLPTAQTLRLLVEPGLSANLMTMTTALHEGGPPLFKWENSFGWSYVGNTTDMIQERVKAAGGNVSAKLRFSLSWTNTDDLDLHLEFQGIDGRRQHLYFRDKTSSIRGLTGGLDVDMNAFTLTREPVENIAFTQLLPGRYRVYVNNYRQREQIDVGFTLQVADEGGGTTNYRFDRSVGNTKDVACLTAVVDKAGGVTYTDINSQLKKTAAVAGSKWGLTFGQFAEVRCVMFSPNFWDDNAIGNKHWFFILKDAKADEAPRGIYNEYLHPDLHKHRKVFDVIGERTKPELQDDQLSGIGISSTLQKSATLEVRTASNRRLYSVQF